MSNLEKLRAGCQGDGGPAHIRRLLRIIEDQWKENTRLRKTTEALVRIRRAEVGRTPLISNQGQALDGISALANYQGVADAALAAEGEGEE